MAEHGNGSWRGLQSERLEMSLRGFFGRVNHEGDEVKRTKRRVSERLNRYCTLSGNLNGKEPRCNPKGLKHPFFTITPSSQTIHLEGFEKALHCIARIGRRLLDGISKTCTKDKIHVFHLRFALDNRVQHRVIFVE